MKRIPIILSVLFFFCTDLFAGHINGGELFYQYLGPGAATNTSRYQLSARLFRDATKACGTSGSIACLPAYVYISVFENAFPFTKITDIKINKTESKIIKLTTYPSCISSKPEVSYEAYTYSGTVTLNNNDVGYVLIYQTCCRAQNDNLGPDPETLSFIPGSTYTATIPGSKILPGDFNSSSVFNLKDTVITCKESFFKFDLGATDIDGDTLSYEFVAAFDGGEFTSAIDEAPKSFNFEAVGYEPPYSAIEPMGSTVTIDPTTGTISGIAPVTGDYVVCVVCYEWRNGKVIAEHRKDFTFKVNNCSLPEVQLQDDQFNSGGLVVNYINCNSNTIQFENIRPDPLGLINSYYWDFGVTSTDADTSLEENPIYSFPDTGIYTITVIANRGEECTKTASALVAIYPGFNTDFSVNGSCIQAPYQFTDLTTVKYGTVVAWSWDFGETGLSTDVSNFQNPSYTFVTTGEKKVKLFSFSSKGCIDSLEYVLPITPGPQLSVPFAETVICSVDSLDLSVTAITPNPQYTWSPNYNILNANTATPKVFPKIDTEYKIRVDDGACKDSLTINVKVVDKVIAELLPDTVICKTDQILIRNNTNAINFIWSPSTDLSASDIAEPTATPGKDIQYNLEASVGSCMTNASVIVSVVPYPIADAGESATICFGKSVQLNASSDGSSYTWTPNQTLVQSNTLSPTAGPISTTKYFLYAYDTKGCPKPGVDSTLVTVIPKLIANAGKDTTVVIQQPLQFNATGGTTYEWTPPIYLSDPTIGNPVGIYQSGTKKISYLLTAISPEGCIATDSITVTVFQTKPDLFIPTAFSPNNDNLNDYFKPSVIGMKQLNYFSVFNRWGQLMFTTNKLNEGWDGIFKGVKQPSGTYVFIAEAITYLGNVVRKKGTVQLIR